jgi:hypothetical protein
MSLVFRARHREVFLCHTTWGSGTGPARAPPFFAGGNVGDGQETALSFLGGTIPNPRCPSATRGTACGLDCSSTVVHPNWPWAVCS